MSFVDLKSWFGFYLNAHFMIANSQSLTFKVSRLKTRLNVITKSAPFQKPITEQPI